MPVFRLGRHRDHGRMGINQRLNRAGGTALSVDARELLMHRNRIRGHLLSRPVVPLPYHFDHLKLLARLIEYLVKTIMAVAGTSVTPGAPLPPQCSRLSPSYFSVRTTPPPS